VTGHRPIRPTWRCKDCAETWPCAPARQALLREYADTRVQLALDLARDFGDAVTDLPGEPVPELYVRFLGWIRRTAL
jgi:hypothetical protein